MSAKYTKQVIGFLNGDTVYYRGCPYTLKWIDKKGSKHIYIECVKNEILIKGANLTPELVRAVLEQWYIVRAKIRYKSRCEYFSKQLEVTYNMIRVKNQSTRWGSCSSKKNLNFNWRLIMGKDEALDYVVVHELCHLKEMNHSKNFWKLVEGVLPDYKEREEWIKQEQNRMLDW